MIFKLEIDTANDAFDECVQGELARIVHKIISTKLGIVAEGPCLDLNGNTVGHWSYECDECHECHGTRRVHDNNEEG